MLPDVDIRFYAYKTHTHTHQLNIYWRFICECCRNNEDMEYGVFSGITNISWVLRDQTNIHVKVWWWFCVVGCKNNLVPSTISTSKPHICLLGS